MSAEVLTTAGQLYKKLHSKGTRTHFTHSFRCLPAPVPPFATACRSVV